MSLRENEITSHPESPTPPIEEYLILPLYEIGAVKVGEFKLKLHDAHPEAPLSPIYLDLRLLRRYPYAKKIAVEVYQSLVKPLDFNLLADIPTAATPLVSSLSDKLDIGMITPRTDSKKHGTGAKVDGMIPSDRGKIVVLIDDLITAADSKIDAALILRDAGMVVTDVVVLIDRQQGGREKLQEQGLNLVSALTMDQLLIAYVNLDLISKSEYLSITERLNQLNQFIQNA